jgi:hypothetical protein
VRELSVLDWNNRVTVAASEVFLLVNGFELGASDDDLKEMTIEVASGRLPKEQVIEIFVWHVVDVLRLLAQFRTQKVTVETAAPDSAVKKST